MLARRFNFRVIAFVVIVIGIVGLPVGLRFHNKLTDGVVRHGRDVEVDLKLMSGFDMDQYSATMADIPRKWRDLEGQRIVMRGEMWAPRQDDKSELTYFQLVDDRHHSSCGPPLAQQFVDGNVVKGAPVQ